MEDCRALTENIPNPKQEHLKPSRRHTNLKVCVVHTDTHALALVCEPQRGATCKSGSLPQTAAVPAQLAELRWIRSVRGRSQRRAQGRTRRTRPAKTRSACSQFTILFDGECVLANTVFSRATLGIIFPLLFWFYFFAFVRGRYGSGLHIRATMPWLHYRLKTGGEAEGPRMKDFSHSHWHISV